MTDIDPGVREQVLHLEFEDLLVDIDIAVNFICLNPAAVRSILPIFRKLTEMTLAGVTSVKERIAGIQEAYAKKEIPPAEPGAMSYMMSKDAYLTHLGSHNLCHVMFFLPIKDPAELNADDPNSPISSTDISGSRTLTNQIVH